MSAELVIVIGLGVFIIAFMKGAFGGGFAVIGIPFLSLAMPPLEAGVLLAPLFILMDVCALYYWRPKTWSGKDLVWLSAVLPLGVCAQAVIGGIVVLTKLNPALVSVHFLLSTAIILTDGLRFLSTSPAGSPCRLS